jgi:hypothetical protein
VRRRPQPFSFPKPPVKGLLHAIAIAAALREAGQGARHLGSLPEKSAMAWVSRDKLNATFACFIIGHRASEFVMVRSGRKTMVAQKPFNCKLSFAGVLGRL